MTHAALNAVVRTWLPTQEEARLLLLDIRREAGSVPAVAAWLGQAERVVTKWIYDQRRPCGASRLAIWFAWSLAFHPQNLIELREMMPHARRWKGPPRR